MALRRSFAAGHLARNQSAPDALPSHQEGTPMDIIRSGSQAPQQGPAEYFTGNVTIEWQFARPSPSRLAAALVSFDAGARSAWHTHPLGQTLFVVSGVGWHQCEGEAREEIRAGDVVWCPPGHRHWHGATPDCPMSHIAVQEALDGKVVEWMEKVSDKEYLGG
jgi:quercetin dioxygenase-like cupin family protein